MHAPVFWVQSVLPVSASMQNATPAWSAVYSRPSAMATVEIDRPTSRFCQTTDQSSVIARAESRPPQVRNPAVQAIDAARHRE